MWHGKVSACLEEQGGKRPPHGQLNVNESRGAGLKPAIC